MGFPPATWHRPGSRGVLGVCLALVANAACSRILAAQISTGYLTPEYEPWMTSIMAPIVCPLKESGTA